MLLKSVIFHYHGLDAEEIQNLEETARELDAHEELQWANRFVSKNYLTAFDRAREYLSEAIGDYPKNKRIKYIRMVWESNNLKGYITELEAAAMLKLARDWKVEEEFKDIVRQKKHTS
ncbi:MAG: hypothetical protein OEY51_05880 [Cyclobacteriaceae bacterium]|nr:hypothetical protein [Cyclobacteriaceae bacterium]